MSTKPNQALTYKRVPILLRDLRDGAGLTQRGLADKMRQTQWFVARCETGSRRIDIAEYVEWCRACGVDPKAILDQLMARR